MLLFPSEHSDHGVASSSWKLLRRQPAECDGRLQAPSWFWDQGARPVSLDTLKNMYLNSVGKNCQLLLNVAPDNTGRFPDEAVSRMKEFGDWIRSVQVRTSTGASAYNGEGTSHTRGNHPRNVLDTDDATAWQPTGTTGNLVLNLGRAKTFNVVNLQENIQVGQRVSSFAVDARVGDSWKEVGNATTIGYRRLLKLPNPVTTNKLRLRITASRALPPAISTFSVHQEGDLRFNLALDKAATQSSTLQSGTEAGKAVDGNTNGSFGSGSVTHTSDMPLDTNPWWQVDIGETRSVGTIELWNRTDCCSDRLRDFYVFASDTPFTSTDPEATKDQPGVWSSHRTAAAGERLTLPVGLDARYVRVQLVGSDRPLSLAEVKVFAG